ncbi:MAG: hypothetical protein FWH40_03880 [Coriobacteriia bacterium]|nr:hypothetical protein [Coriobacteriia bacterium]MCL2136646.1 hypothetical protein [Coriobacteriia bacterium]
MKKSVSLALATLLMLSQMLATACSDSNKQSPSSDSQQSLGPSVNAGLNDASPNGSDEDNWWQRYFWRLEGSINQKEEFGTQAGHAGMYADYAFTIEMTGGKDPVHDNSTDYAEGYYDLSVRSSITIDTDEAADNILNDLLGSDVSGMDLGIDVVLAGEYRSDIPYYIGADGFPVIPPYDEEDGMYIFPEGTEDASTGPVYVHRVPKNWQSPIKDKNRQTVQPPTSSWLMFEAFKMEYTGTSSHALVGTFGEDVNYDVLLFIVIDENYHAKIYLNLTTSVNHEIWLEGDGELVLEHT